MAWLRWLLTLSLVGCIEPADVDLASGEAIPALDGKADAPGWETAATLHANAQQLDVAHAGARRVHALWIAGPVSLAITAHANAGDSVRVAVLGPVDHGARPVLAAAGYSKREQDVAVAFDATTSGEHLVVIGSFRLATSTTYELSATTDQPERVDALASPKDFALVGDAQRLVKMELGAMLVDQGDFEVELWSSPPLRPELATLVATSEASGSQVNVIAPYPAVHWGDDLQLVVREAGGGRVLDTGVATRFLPTPTNFVRLDAIRYNASSLQIAGAVGYFEGVADLRLRSETRHRELAQAVIHADRPGMVGNGFNAFDATFVPDAHDGELLSVGFVTAADTYRRLGCFDYHGPARPCP